MATAIDSEIGRPGQYTRRMIVAIVLAAVAVALVGLLALRAGTPGRDLAGTSPQAAVTAVGPNTSPLHLERWGEAAESRQQSLQDLEQTELIRFRNRVEASQR